jgi:hypothetical protein
MRLTWFEQFWLSQLIYLRRHPPTQGRYILRATVGCAVYCALGLALAILLGRTESALAYFAAGAICYSAVMVFCLALRIALRWRLTEAIVNWDRVEELHAAGAQRHSVIPPRRTG